MHMLADSVEVVIGVDTHKHTHTAAVVAAATGAVIQQVTVPATPAGYQQLLELAGRQSSRRIWAVESTGGYGAGLTRSLAAHHERVVELDRPKRAARRHGARSDPLDATRAAREALGRDQFTQPRAAGHRAAFQVRLTARRSAVQAAGDAQRQLHALVVAAPDTLRGRLRGLTTARLVATCGRLRQRTDWDTETAVTAASLRALARRVQLLDAETAQHTRAITTLVRAWRPDLLTDPESARSWPPLCCAPGPCRPLPDQRRLRHDRRGRAHPRLQWPDRALPTQPVRGPSPQPSPPRRRHDQTTNRPSHPRLPQRRRAQGKTNLEIKRCLVARQS
jgi:transposase